MYALKAIDYYLSIKAQFPDIDSWTAESVVAEFGEENMNTIKAIGTCFTTDVPWEDFRVFEKVVLCLNDRLVFGDIVQDLDIKEIALAVHVMKKLFPEKDSGSCGFVKGRFRVGNREFWVPGIVRPAKKGFLEQAVYLDIIRTP